MDKEVCTFLKLADLIKNHHPWLVPLGLLHLTGLQELFPGSLASYNWSGLPSGQLLPTWHRWPASTAIWANCQVSDDSGDLPTSPTFSTSAILFSILLNIGGAFTSGTGGSAGAGSSCSVCTSALVLTCRAFLPSPILGIFFVLAILEEKTSQSEARAASWKSCDICFGLISVSFFFQEILHNP